MPGKAKSKKVRKSSKKKRFLVKKKEPTKLELTQKKVLDFLALGETKRIAVIADNDQDGLTAAVQMKKFLDSKRIDTQVFFYDHYSREISPSANSLFEFSPEKTIFLDLNESFISDSLRQIGKSTGPFVVIDHHQ